MRTLGERIISSSNRGSREDRQSLVNKTLRWNRNKGTHMVRWKDLEAMRMQYENLQWRRRTIEDTVNKTKESKCVDKDARIKRFGTGSTVYTTTSKGKRGLERTVSHTSTRVNTSAKIAVRKIRGGRIRGMKVLAYMNTARWNHMSTAEREKVIQCPCEGGLQNVEHVMSECEYMVLHLDKMVDTVNRALKEA